MKDSFSIDKILSIAKLPLTPFIWAYDKIKETDFSSMKDSFTIDKILSVAKLPLTPFIWAYDKIKETDFSSMKDSFNIDKILSVAKLPLTPFIWAYDKIKETVFDPMKDSFTIDKILSVAKLPLTPFIWAYDKIKETNFDGMKDSFSINNLISIAKLPLTPFIWAYDKIKETNFDGMKDSFSIDKILSIAKLPLTPFIWAYDKIKETDFSSMKDSFNIDKILSVAKLPLTPFIWAYDKIKETVFDPMKDSFTIDKILSVAKLPLTPFIWAYDKIKETNFDGMKDSFSINNLISIAKLPLTPFIWAYDKIKETNFDGMKDSFSIDKILSIAKLPLTPFIWAYDKIKETDFSSMKDSFTIDKILSVAKLPLTPFIWAYDKIKETDFSSMKDSFNIDKILSVAKLPLTPFIWAYDKIKETVFDPMKDSFTTDNVLSIAKIPLTPFAWAYGKIKEIDFSTMFTTEDIIDVAKIPLKPFTYLSNNLPTSIDYSKFFSIETVTKTFKAALTPFTWIYNQVSAKKFSDYISLEDLSGVGKAVLKPFTYIGKLVTETKFSDYLSLQPIKEVGKTLLKPFEYIGTEINKVDWAGLFSFDPSKIFPNLSNDISGDIAEWFGNIDLPAFEPSKWANEIKSLGTVAFDFLTDLVKGIRIDSVASLFPQATGGLAGTGKDIPLSGLVKGPGTGTSDSIPVRLSNGEYVIPAKQTAEYADVLNQIRAGTFGKGLPGDLTIGDYAAGIKSGKYATKDNKGFFDALGKLKTYDANGNPTGHYWMPEYAPIMDSLGSAFTSGLPSNSSVNYGGKDYGIAAFNKLMMKGISGAGQLVRTALGKYSWDNTGEMSDWVPTMGDTLAVGTSTLNRESLINAVAGNISGLSANDYKIDPNFTTLADLTYTNALGSTKSKGTKDAVTGEWSYKEVLPAGMDSFSEATKDALLAPKPMAPSSSWHILTDQGKQNYVAHSADIFSRVAAHNKYVKDTVANPKVFANLGANDINSVGAWNQKWTEVVGTQAEKIAKGLTVGNRYLGAANTNEFNIGKVIDASLATVGGNKELKDFLEKAGYTQDATGIDKLISDDKNASILKQVAANASKTNQVALNGYSIPANVMASLISDKQLGMGHWGLDSNTGSYNYTEDDVATGAKIRETVLGLTNTQGETIAERVPVDKPVLQLDTQGKWKFPEIKVPAETQQKISAQLVKKVATKQTKVSDWIQPKVPAKTSTTPYMTVDLSTRKVGLNQGSDPFAHIKELLSPTGVKKFGSDSVKMASYLADKLYKTGTDTAISLKDFYNSMTADGYIDAGKVGALPDFKLPDTLFALDNVKTKFPFDAKFLGEQFASDTWAGYTLQGSADNPNGSYFPFLLDKNASPKNVSGAKANLDQLVAYVKAGGAMTSEQTLGADWVLGKSNFDINKLRPPTMLDKIGNWLIKPAGADAGVPPVLQAYDTSTAAGLSQFYPKIFSDSIYANKALDSITGAVGSPVSPAELDLLSNDINFNELTSSLSGKLNQDWGANILTDIRANSNLPTVIDQSTYPNPNYGLWDRVLSWVGLSDKAQTLTAEQYYDYRLYKDYKPLAVSKPSGPSNFKFTTDPITQVPMFAVGSGNLLKDWAADPNPAITLAKDVQGTGMASNWDAGWKNDFGFSNNNMTDLSDGITALMATVTTNPGETAMSLLKSVGQSAGLSILLGLGANILSSFFSGSGGSDYYGFGTAATGGLITGPGTGTSDSIPTMLSNGEFVINAAATAKNRALVEAINSGATISSAASPIMAVPTASKANSTTNTITNNSVINMNITGDISRQTRAEISQMLPQIAAGVNQYNRERNYRG
jgi:hypothetical protein